MLKRHSKLLLVHNTTKALIALVYFSNMPIYPYSNIHIPYNSPPPSHYMEHFGAQRHPASCRVAYLKIALSQPLTTIVLGRRLRA